MALESLYYIEGIIRFICLSIQVYTYRLTVLMASVIWLIIDKVESEIN